MYLYDRKDEIIYVHSLEASKDDLYNYRFEQLKQIPYDEMIFRGVTGIGIEEYEIFKEYRDKLDSVIIQMKNVNGKYHQLERDYCYGSGIIKKQLLEDYYMGKLNDKKIATVQDLKELKYFLLSRDEYIYYPNRKILKGILQIPKSLYLLSLIEQEKYSLIKDEDIEEQLSLFNFKQMGEIDLNYLAKLEFFGIASNCVLNTIKKAENDEHILKLLKNKR